MILLVNKTFKSNDVDFFINSVLFFIFISLNLGILFYYREDYIMKKFNITKNNFRKQQKIIYLTALVNTFVSANIIIFLLWSDFESVNLFHIFFIFYIMFIAAIIDVLLLDIYDLMTTSNKYQIKLDRFS